MSVDWKTFPSLTALRAFEAAARLQNFSRAARDLNVTHAAIAQQVRALEVDLGRELIYRQGRGLALTPEGEILARSVREGFSRIDQGLEAVSADTGALRAPVIWMEGSSPNKFGTA